MLATQNRIVFLDYLRVVACFMVMAIHSAEPFYLGGNHVYGLGLYGTSFAQGARSREMDLLEATGSDMIATVNYSTSGSFMIYCSA